MEKKKCHLYISFKHKFPFHLCSQCTCSLLNSASRGRSMVDCVLPWERLN
uniref:Uncharacterized protein n=1 Tax=Rhizophora mucronata TaxID=61149 RepID=A0A2P2QBZ9_RHIMU